MTTLSGLKLFNERKTGSQFEGYACNEKEHHTGYCRIELQWKLTILAW